ncbi:MAG TPA: maltotransferase domain-containing protein, partial [Afifellaceae bacterium]|nr:maltotransferase domain-containing protein [Afifellaceae bacterium]
MAAVPLEPNRVPGSSEERLRALAANRVVIEAVAPEIDCGRFPAKRVVGNLFAVEADIYGDGHDVVTAALTYRAAGQEGWREAPMAFVDNDRWRGSFTLEENGRYLYSILAWRDLFATWRADTAKKHAAGQPISLELLEACLLVQQALEHQGEGGADRGALQQLLSHLGKDRPEGDRLALLMEREVAELMRRAAPRTNLSRYPRELEVLADREAAAFSAWYELMPRSMSD